MNYFTQENTENYSDNELTIMNDRLESVMADYDQDDLDYEQYLKNHAEKIQHDFDQE